MGRVDPRKCLACKRLSEALGSLTPCPRHHLADNGGWPKPERKLIVPESAAMVRAPKDEAVVASPPSRAPGSWPEKFKIPVQISIRGRDAT